MNPIQLQQNRRSFLHESSFGIGTLALGALLNRNLLAAQETDRWLGVARPTAFLPRCKHVIHLCMAGGPSHLETLDYKPRLAELDGQPMPKSMTEGQQIAQLQDQRDKLEFWDRSIRFDDAENRDRKLAIFCPTFKGLPTTFASFVQCTPIKSITIRLTRCSTQGPVTPGRPSMGSWLLYGLGAECDNLPGYVVLTSVGGGQSQRIASRQWHSGFLQPKPSGCRAAVAGRTRCCT